MEVVTASPIELVKKLCELTGLDQKQLAEKTGISEQTLSGWINEPGRRISSKSITKLGEAMRKNNWGIKLGNVTRSKIEIITNSDSQPDPNHSKLKDDFIELVRENLNLKKEVMILKDKLEYYEGNK